MRILKIFVFIRIGGKKMRIMGKNYDNKALGMGAILAFASMIIPKISEPVINLVTSIRNKVSGGK